MTASMKVNAGMRLQIDEERTGELYSIPLNPHIFAKNLHFKKRKKEMGA